MPKSTKQRPTENPIGKKFHEVMAEKAITGDYRALALAFKVATPSVYDWIDHGRISKERYPRLAEWSGRSLDWWFDVPPETVVTNQQHMVSENVAVYRLEQPLSTKTALAHLRGLLLNHSEERRTSCSALLARLATEPEKDGIVAELEMQLDTASHPVQTSKRFAG